MKVIVITLVAASMLSGCAIPDRIKNVRKCTLGCGTFEVIQKNNGTFAKRSQNQSLTTPSIINERPSK
jgi:hypothetical protein